MLWFCNSLNIYIYIRLGAQDLTLRGGPIIFRYATGQTPFNCDSSLATNTVSQSSENSVSSQQIPNQRQHPSTKTSGPAYWQLQVSGHISSLPSLANLDNLPKQNNVNIFIDIGSTSENDVTCRFLFPFPPKGIVE
ncbi:uncharacterized protein TNCV_4652081 [Trichonephila clavipes]|nr:uncharacterized protein TNCV_4652081 [Trichonephila clavipes]